MYCVMTMPFSVSITFILCGISTPHPACMHASMLPYVGLHNVPVPQPATGDSRYHFDPRVKPCPHRHPPARHRQHTPPLAEISSAVPWSSGPAPASGPAFNLWRSHLLRNAEQRAGISVVATLSNCECSHMTVCMGNQSHTFECDLEIIA